MPTLVDTCLSNMATRPNTLPQVLVGAARHLINETNAHGNTPLHEAAYEGRLDNAHALLRLGAALEIKNDPSERGGLTPLLGARQSAYSCLWLAVGYSECERCFHCVSEESPHESPSSPQPPELAWHPPPSSRRTVWPPARRPSLHRIRRRRVDRRAQRRRQPHRRRRHTADGSTACDRVTADAPQLTANDAPAAYTQATRAEQHTLPGAAAGPRRALARIGVRPASGTPPTPPCQPPPPPQPPSRRPLLP